MGQDVPEVVAEATKPLGIDKLKAKLDKRKAELEKITAERLECAQRMKELKDIEEKLAYEIEVLKADMRALLGL